MKQSALRSVFFFQRMVIGLDNYKGKESLSRGVVILLEDKHLERQRKRQVFQSQQNIKLTNLYLMELQKIELCMNLMYVERRNTL